MYRSIHQLPLNNFITCACDEDFTALIIEGDAPVEELATAWEIIFQEYLDAMKDDNLQYIDKLTKEHNLIQTKCNVVKLLVDALRYIYVDYLADELKRWYGMPVSLNPKDKEGFKRELNLIAARNQRWLSDALQIKNQIMQLQPAGQDDVKMTHTWFDQQIVALSRFSKYHINKKETTVSEFVIMIQDLQQAAKQINEFSKN